MKRRLVKSPPELWAELSEVERLARHLGAFGEIRITRTEPEHTVNWEGERGNGSVSIESSGWGTQVVVKAKVAEAPPAEPAPVETPPVEPPPVEEPPADEPPVEVPPTEEPPEETPPGEGPAMEDPPPTGEAEAVPAPRRGFFSRLFGGWQSWAERPRTTQQHEPEPPPAAQPEPQVKAEPNPGPESVPEPPPPTPQPPPDEPVLHDPDPHADGAPAFDPDEAKAALESMLDTLGAAHHRPFSRG